MSQQTKKRHSTSQLSPCSPSHHCPHDSTLVGTTWFTIFSDRSPRQLSYCCSAWTGNSLWRWRSRTCAAAMRSLTFSSMSSSNAAAYLRIYLASILSGFPVLDSLVLYGNKECHNDWISLPLWSIGFPNHVDVPNKDWGELEKLVIEDSPISVCDDALVIKVIWAPKLKVLDYWVTYMIRSWHLSMDLLFSSS